MKIKGTLYSSKISARAEFETAWKNRVLRISYSTEEGWEDFRFCTSREDELWLVKELEQPKAVECDVNGERAFWIKFSLLDIHAVTDTETHGVGIAVSGTSSAPDAVVTKMGTVDENAFYAFGETPALFDSVYFGSDEALSKAGGEISVQFNVSFSPLPDIKAVEKPADGNWKTVMRKSDMHIEEPDIVSIKSVVWEYYNGTGWKPLNCSPEMKNTFCPVEGTKTYNLTFRCPDDISPYIAEADERRFIRARIVRMEQSFRWNAIYHAPLLSYIRFQYRCDSFIPVDIAIAENRMKSEIHGGEETFLMFEPMKLDIPAWYLGFTRPLTGGPHRFLISLGQQSDTVMPMLKWEYFSGGEWKDLNCYDETDQLAHTGLLTVWGNQHHTECELFRKKLYWLRVTDVTDSYKNYKKTLPHITGIYPNSTELKHSQELPPEYFSLPAEVPDYVCELSQKSICSAEVWVNEIEFHGAEAVRRLLREGRADPEYDSYGVLCRLWVRWESVDDFMTSLPDDRHCRIDLNGGTVTFGDGLHGKIPYSSAGDHVRIYSSTGGGECGNVPENAINRGQYALGLVTKIGNPLQLSGGNDMEQVDVALDRIASSFQNGGRCVTTRDYEDIARQTERSILKVKCIAGINAEGEPESGSITLLVLCPDYTRESSGFTVVQSKLICEIRSRQALSLSLGKLYVTHPQYIKICVNVRTACADSTRLYRIQEQINRKITEFLNPITGNFDGKGWNIGEIPHWRQIENAVRSVSGVGYVEELMMRGFLIKGQEQIEVDLRHMAKTAYSIAVSGEHNVQVVLYKDRR